jgi:hypothetical protein
MKNSLFVCAILLLLAMPSIAANVSLEWDASVTPEVQGYAVFIRDYTHGYNYDSPGCSVSVLTCTIVVPDDRQTAFVARAWMWGPYDLSGNRTKLWSDNSNEVVYIPSVPPPSPPGGLLWKILVAVLDFFDSFLA